MKKSSIQVLVEPTDIHTYVRNLWKTDLFRQSHDAGGFVAKVVDEYAALPRFFMNPQTRNWRRRIFRPGGAEFSCASMITTRSTIFITCMK